MSSLRVLHLSGGLPEGGAGSGAVALATALTDAGVDSQIVFPRLARGVFAAGSPGLADLLKLRANRKLSQWMRAEGPRDIRVAPFRVSMARLANRARAADVIHVHWMSDGAVELDALLALGRPVVLTLRDMWPLTAGCPYDLGCDGRDRECAACPAMRWPFRRLSHRLFDRQKATASHPALRVVAISRWLRDEAMLAGALRGLAVEWIPNLAAARFERAQVRPRPADQLPLIVTGSFNLADPYKNMAAIRELWPMVRDRRVRLAAFGRGQECLAADAPPGVTFTGPLTGDAVADLLGEADVFVSPSRQEAFGKTALEAAFAGAAVIAGAGTGTADIVEHGVTGLLVDPAAPGAFAEAVDVLLSDRQRLAEMGRAGRARAQRLFAGNVIAQRHIELYQGLLGNFRQGNPA